VLSVPAMTGLRPSRRLAPVALALVLTLSGRRLPVANAAHQVGRVLHHGGEHAEADHRLQRLARLGSPLAVAEDQGPVQGGRAST